IMDSRGKVFRRRLSAGSRLRAARGIERSEHLRAVRSWLTLGLPSITQIEGAQIGVIDGLTLEPLLERSRIAPAAFSAIGLGFFQAGP
ncbi:hypothetical protein MNU23_18875, partial [Pseudomonas aeruginosa]|uniref:hypothetical protein n=1 Tax=Pseudomonas aeruginosa TaxID=287 RepID=UPI0021A75B9A